MYANRMNNDMAVSPIVATLVLIVVAVIGAVAVGTIMGTFSTDVSKQTNSGQASSASQTEIVIAGSTSVQPLAEEVAKVYEKANPGIKITVQGGGSGAGVQAAALKLADIGTTSDIGKVTPALSTYPDLKTYQVGGSGVVFITNKANPANVSVQDETHGIVIADLNTLYTTSVGAGTLVATAVPVHRAESSGTEDTAVAWVTTKTLTSFDGISSTASKNLTAATGNAGVLSTVQSTKYAIGFVDLGYAYKADGTLQDNIIVLNPTDSTGNVFVTSKAGILKSAKDIVAGKAAPSYTAGMVYYPQGLSKALYYITNGEPSSVVKNFIQFTQSNGANDAIHAAGVFSNVDLSNF
jgi:phosphate transport system substrate-binding protein